MIYNFHLDAYMHTIKTPRQVQDPTTVNVGMIIRKELLSNMKGKLTNDNAKARAHK